MNKTGKLAVIGDMESVFAFKAVGAEVFTASNVFEANDILRKLSKEDYAVIYITEDIAALIESTLKILKTRAYPVVIPIPNPGKSNGFGMRGVKADVEKAIGVDIIFRDN